MKYLLAFIFFINSLLSSQPFIKQRLINAEPGDYVLYEKQKNLHLLHVHSINGNKLILEEMSYSRKKLKLSVKEWLATCRPEFSSHNMLEIDLSTGKILECYSFTMQRFLDISKEECFILNLIELDFKHVKPENRRKIGPAPLDGLDRRRAWSPPHIVDGKKIKTNYSVLAARWPSDSTPLSDKRIETYFDPSHPFAYWIEVKDNSGLALRISCKDSGKGLKTQAKGMPRRRARITSTLKETNTELSFNIFCPAYYENFKLYAKNVDSVFSSPYQIDFSTSFNEKTHTLSITINKAKLRKILELNQNYSFDFQILTPIHTILESMDTFHLAAENNKFT